MSELIVFVLRVSFLALLWLFIFFIAGVIRTDMWGRPVTEKEKTARTSFSPPSTPPLAAANRSAPPQQKQRSSRQQPTQLTMDNGPLAGRAFTLASELRLGRGVDNEIILTDDFASGHHARIAPESDGVYLTDLNSTNGTFINEIRVDAPHRLSMGDKIRIGRTTMTLGR